MSRNLKQVIVGRKLLEENDSFLDFLMKRKSNGTLGLGVYRKLTLADRYLNAKSHHLSQKQGIINICEPEADSDSRTSLSIIS